MAVLPPSETQQFAKRIDSINVAVLRDHIFATPDPQLTDEEWDVIMPRIKMHLRTGGLGVLSLADRALMAFVATQFQVRAATDSKSKRVAKKSDAQVAAEAEAAERKKVREMPHVDHEYHARGPHLTCTNYMTSLTTSTTFIHYST